MPMAKLSTLTGIIYIYVIGSGMLAESLFKTCLEDSSFSSMVAVWILFNVYIIYIFNTHLTIFINTHFQVFTCVPALYKFINVHAIMHYILQI